MKEEAAQKKKGKKTGWVIVCLSIISMIYSNRKELHALESGLR